MRGRQSRKRGFTLIETVVTVGIVAALAAVVYPQVVKQFDSADPSRAAEDLNSISTAISAFSVNVRPHQPADVEDLVFALRTVVATDSTALGARYSTSDSAAWLGPYLGASTTENVAGNATVITTGFDGAILNEFARYDINGADIATGGEAETLANVALAEFLAVQISGLSDAAFSTLNALIDGPSENTDNLRRWGGRLRCPGAFTAGDPCAAAYFLAAPLRQ